MSGKRAGGHIWAGANPAPTGTGAGAGLAPTLRRTPAFAAHPKFKNLIKYRTGYHVGKKHAGRIFLSLPVKIILLTPPF
jgi:hypothetical protein